MTGWVPQPQDISRRKYPHHTPTMRQEGGKVEMTTLTWQLHKTIECILHVCAEVLAMGRCRGGHFGKRSQLSHGGYSHASQQTHLRAKLSPSAKPMVPLGKHIQERTKNAGQAEEERKNKSENQQ